MHRSVLLNKKYIKFAGENTVEVIAQGRVKDAIAKNDPDAATYEVKGKDGQKSTYMVNWPNLTADEMDAIASSKAGTYNQTGKIPYTAVINPHTEEEMHKFSGGRSAKALMGMATEAKKALNQEYGPSLSRKALRKIEKEKQAILGILAKGQVGPAMTKYLALQKKVLKQPEAVRSSITPVLDEILKAAERQLAQAERLMDNGDVKKAARILRPLVRALRNTPLEERVQKLVERSKSA
ncbi:MAG: hypothetical protein ACE5JG_08065 [Planctomycetota bacterium]